MDSIHEKEYLNLRRCFRWVVSHTLGLDYKNDRADIPSSDAKACVDIMDAWDGLEREKNDYRKSRNEWRMFALMAVAAWVITIFVYEVMR